MSTNTNMTDAIHAVVDKAKSHAASAAPKDLVYLAKSLESVGPSSELAFITTVGETQATAIETKGTEGTAAINTAKSNAVTAINALATTNTMPYGRVGKLMNSYGNTGDGGAYRRSTFIDTDGVIWAYGCDNSQSLGNGQAHANSMCSPVQWDTDSNGGVGPAKFVKVESSNYTNMALDEDGQLWSWGYNGYGHTGQGHTTEHGWGVRCQTPTGKVFTDFCMSKSSDNNQESTTLALSDTGEVYSWGYNSQGQCGRNGSANNTITYLPAKIMSLNGINIVRVYNVNGRGNGFAGVIDEDGKLYMWGYQNQGNLGFGHTSDVYSPAEVTISGLNTDEKIIHLQMHGQDSKSTCLVTSEGRMFGTGYNGHGQLSTSNTTEYHSFTLSTWFDGTTDDRTIKVDTTVHATTKKLIAGTGGIYGEWIAAYLWGSNEQHGSRFALSVSNKLYVWGNNESWSMGVSSGNTDGNPPIMTIQADVKFLSRGGAYNYQNNVITLADGTIMTSGYNGNYALCTGDNNNRGGWVKPKLPQGLDGNIKCAIGRGTSSEQCMDVLGTDGSYYTVGYSGEHSQGTQMNSTTANLHPVTYA